MLIFLNMLCTKLSIQFFYFNLHIYRVFLDYVSFRMHELDDFIGVIKLENDVV
jgi:hypothetical protein